MLWHVTMTLIYFSDLTKKNHNPKTKPLMLSKYDPSTYTVIWGITGHFLHFECVRKNYKGF